MTWGHKSEGCALKSRSRRSTKKQQDIFYFILYSEKGCETGFCGFDFLCNYLTEMILQLSY